MATVGSKLIFLVFATSKGLVCTHKRLSLTSLRQKMLLKDLIDPAWITGPFLNQSLRHGICILIPTLWGRDLWPEVMSGKRVLDKTVPGVKSIWTDFWAVGHLRVFNMLIWKMNLWTRRIFYAMFSEYIWIWKFLFTRTSCYIDVFYSCRHSHTIISSFSFCYQSNGLRELLCFWVDGVTKVYIYRVRECMSVGNLNYQSKVSFDKFVSLGERLKESHYLPHLLKLTFGYMGKDGLAYVTSWQQGLCSFLWTLARLCYGMTGLAHWFLALEFAKRWLVTLEFIIYPKLGFLAFFCYLTPPQLSLVVHTHFYWNVLFSVPGQGCLFHT